MRSRCSLPCASSSALRAVSASIAPISPRASAICSPRPREPPVTSATLPVRSISFLTLIGKTSLVNLGNAAWSCRRYRLKPRVTHIEAGRIELAQEFVLRRRLGQFVAEEILAGLQLALVEIRVGSLCRGERAPGEHGLAQ